MGHSWPFFFIFIFSIQLTVNKYSLQKFAVTGFELWTSGVGSDSSTNRAEQPLPISCLFVDPIYLLTSLSTSVTRLGEFWNFLVTNFITKVAQMFGDILGSCENHRFLSRTGEATFWAFFGKTWATFSFKI